MLPGFAALTPAEAGLRRATPQLHVDVLLLREAQELLQALLAAEARLLHAAKRRAEKMAADFVDPDIADLDRHRGAMRLGEIVGPDRAGETVLDRIYFVEHARLVGPREDREQRAEDL